MGVAYFQVSSAIFAHSPQEPTMCKLIIPLTGAVLSLALGASLSAGDGTSGLVHGAAALRAQDDPAAQAVSFEAARQASAAPGRAPFLLSPFGHMTPASPESLPADPAVRTHGGLYATRQQADDLDGQLGGAVVWVDVDGANTVLVDRALGHVHGLMAAKDLGADAPVFVTASDLAAAARLVDQLSEQGLTRVFLITR
jgi:hypothetical protein